MSTNLMYKKMKKRKSSCRIALNSIRVKEIVDENFQDYKKSSMMIATEKCDFKCMKELGVGCEICQNMSIVNMPSIEVSYKNIFSRYISNPITSAVIIGGLEPMLQFDEVFGLIGYFRKNGCFDDFVIYTGYYKNEIANEINRLKDFGGIIVKFGRYIPGRKNVFDDVLGVYLSSDNQFAERIS